LFGNADPVIVSSLVVDEYVQDREEPENPEIVLQLVLKVAVY